jgi:branched-chain amino acid transport system substrate-binding protein
VFLAFETAALFSMPEGMCYYFQRTLTMKRIIPFLIPALSLFLLLPRPSGHASETNGDQRPLFIAVVAPLSGPLAECGSSMLRGATLRVDERGDQSHPHGKAVRLIALDDRGEPTRALELAGHMARHPSIVAVVGHLTTGCTLSAVPFYHAARLTTVSPVATGSDLDTVKSPYLFRTILSERQQATSLARYIHGNMGSGTVALLYEESPLGAQLKEAFLLTAEELGLSVKSFSMGTNPTARLQDALHEIALLKPEALFVSGGLHSAARILRTWPEGIERPVILGTQRLISEEFRELVGDQQRGIMAAHPSIRAPDFQRATEIRARYEKTWKYRMDWLAAQAYDAVDLLLWAIGESGLNLNSLNEAVRGLNSKKHALPGLAGPLYFDRDGSLAREATVAEYLHGRWRLRKGEAVGSTQ